MGKYRGKMAKVIFQNAEFHKTVMRAQDIPKPVYPEVAFIGRSNVGKSSLINAILGKKNLARISSTPGKTRGINYYLVDQKFFFVDLPGYGFAKLSKTERLKWQELIETYLTQSKNLRLICLLMDSRHDLMDSDLEMAQWLQYHERPFCIILTKTDKLSKNALAKRVSQYKSYFPDHYVLPFSIKDKNLIKSTALFIKESLI